MSTTPPTAQALLDALDANTFACTLVQAALFLASPLTCVPPHAVGSDSDRVWIRDTEILIDGNLDDLGTNEIAVHISALAALAQHTQDTYLDLSTDPACWFKVIQAGSRRRIAGLGLLWGEGPVWAEKPIRYSQIAAFSDHLRKGIINQYPAIINGGDPFVAEKVGKNTILRPLESPRQN